MHPHRLYHLLPSSSSPHLVIFLFFLLIFVNISLAQDNENYTSCGRPFRCGDVTTTFPFWGQDRPSACGHPDFKLECSSDNDIPSIDILSQTYRVIAVSPIFNIARMDIVEGICPPQSSSNIDNSTPFRFNSSANRNLSLFECPTVPSGALPGRFEFTCTSSGVSHVFYYFVTPNGTEIADCKNSFVVPVLQTSFNSFFSNPSNQNQGLIDLLSKGFQVEWTIDMKLCSRCIQSGGRCGYNGPNPICFCSDGPHETPCTPPATSPDSPSEKSNKTIDQKKKSNKTLSVGLGAGISAFGVIFLLCFFLIYRRRQRNKLRQLPSSSSPILLSNKSISSKTISKIDMDYEEGSDNFTGLQIFTYSELDEATDHFDASKELGDGGFGTVYYGVLKDGRQVAVKRLFENNYKRVEQFMNEVEILTRMRHQNLVTLYGSTSHNSRELILVYEFVANGTVADHLHGGRSKPGQLKWPSRMNIAMESAGALTYLHASDIIHRDVKTTNILLDKNFGVKVADFGLSRLFPTNVTHVSTAPQGTPGYVDPEYYQCYQITDKSDVYSFGVVLIELISSKPAVDTNRHRYEINLASMAINKIRNGELHEMVDPYLGFESDQIVRRMIISVAELAFRCLQQQREMRPSMAEVWEVLKGIKSEVYKMENADVVDIPADDIGLLDDIRTISLESTTTTSKSTTPNTSSSSA